MVIPNETKVQVISLIKMGKSTSDIRQHFKNRYTRQQIAAIRAWQTMGKYTGSLKKTPIRTLTEEHRLTILRMVGAGASTQDIMKTLPYTRQQIAAIRAWQTMGAY